MRYRIIITEEPNRQVAIEKLASALLAAARAKRDDMPVDQRKQEKAS